MTRFTFRRPHSLSPGPHGRPRLWPAAVVVTAAAVATMAAGASGHSGSALFIFASENGAIDAWNPGVGATGTGPSTVTETPIDNGANAVYKGLAIAQASDGNTYLYAANFRSGRVEVYDSNFRPAQLPGGLFTDPGIPAGYAPFGIPELAGQLYVSYAKQDAALIDAVAR